MLSYFQSYFTGSNLDPAAKYSKKKKQVPDHIYRDELEKKGASPPSVVIRRRSANYGGADSKIPLIPKEDEQEENKSLERKGKSRISQLIHKEEEEEEEEEVIRIKVLMTREEAVGLLSKCKQGGILEFKDVADELGKIPTNRVTVANSFSITPADQMLGPIAE